MNVRAWTAPRKVKQRRVNPWCLLLSLAAILPPNARAQEPSATSGAVISAGVLPKSWIQAAAANEIQIVENYVNLPLRYTMNKVDAKGETVREIIETKDGSVARLIKKNGQALTSEEDSAERDRLKDILRSPDIVAKHHSRDNSVRDYSVSLIRLVPEAMIFAYVPGQPQISGDSHHQIVIDFKPDPAFRPPTMMSELLTGLAGRVWIDAQSQRLIRIEGTILRPVNFGWGIVARIYPGGTIEFEQQNVGGNIWAYSRVNSHLKIRAMMLKTEDENTQVQAYDFRMLPTQLSVQDAVNALLSMQIPLR